MSKDIFFEGLIISFLDITSGKEEYLKCILAETHEKGFVFQIICISGYHSGKIFGFVKEELKMSERNIRGISKNHLISELKRNFIYVEGSLIIEKNG